MRNPYAPVRHDAGDPDAPIISHPHVAVKADLSPGAEYHEIKQAIRAPVDLVDDAVDVAPSGTSTRHVCGDGSFDGRAKSVHPRSRTDVDANAMQPKIDVNFPCRYIKVRIVGEARVVRASDVGVPSHSGLLILIKKDAESRR